MISKWVTAVGLVWLVLLCGCAHLPPIQPATGQPTDSCDLDGLFPEGEWQVIHTIEATPPNGQRLTLLGVCRIASESRTIHCVLMSLEGLVLFEAEYTLKMRVIRSLPPFDKPGFGQGLIDDLVLVFLRPVGPPQSSGHLGSGASVCRWRYPDGSALDIDRTTNGEWEIRRYNDRAGLVRQVTPLQPTA